MQKSAFILCWLALTPWLSGCVPVVVTGAATTTGVVAAQERSTGNAMDDAGIKITIDNLYFQYDVNDLFKNVNVHVSEGRVLLTGAVDRQDTKMLAVKFAWQAKGVREVMDEVQVNPNSGAVDFARDTWISAQIRSRLLLEKNVRSINYNAETVDGVVYLLGIAQDEEELRKVTYIASTTKYVKQVVSHVILKDDPRRQAWLTRKDKDKQPPSHSSGQPETNGHIEESPAPSPSQSSGQSSGGQPETAEHMQQQ